MHNPYGSHQHTIAYIQQKRGSDFDVSKIAEKAGLDISVTETMVKGEPVYKWQAEKILKAMSILMGWHYTLDTVQVALKPDPISFIQLRARHYFNIRELAEKIAGTSPVIQQAIRAGTARPDEQLVRAWELIIYHMLVGEPVKEADALQILAMLTDLIEEIYTLDRLDIKLLDTPLQG